MKSKILLALAPVLGGGLFIVAGCRSTKPSIYLEACPSPDKLKQFYSDSEYQFGLVGTPTGVLVFSQKWRQWKRITKVSLENAKLGHQPRMAEIYMNFSQIYKNADYAPLPLRTSMDGAGGFSIQLDKIDFDGNRNIYLMVFNSNWHDDAITTILEIRKKDLDESFNAK